MLFRQTRYNDAVWEQVSGLCQRVLGDDKAPITVGMVALFTKENADRQRINIREIMKRYRKSGLTHEEAAISLMDGCITELKIMAKVIGEMPSDIGEFIRQVEEILDDFVERGFQSQSIRVFPRNGRQAENYTNSGLDKFLTP